ncbi:alpha-amylase family glycosyl hydrolase [Pararhodonellum marinum]|uniref:alpha-amylase family glycosyl hydrolase n=1 Tax=Pararhodonellum marinum TaxID=2755358 RepID=UPI00188F11F9|nr:alpha-amylase family glycosyl hydrolase [Pararhodonellum marinum]
MEEKLREGMGAIVSEDGVTFRVWAPNAQRVFVMGSFNKWNDESNELEHRADGYWDTFVEGAKTGDEYKYVLLNGEQKLSRNDPYARLVTQSNGNSVIYDPYKDWEDHQFQIAPFNELVIYEIHIGTFNREGLEEDQVGTFYTAVEKLDYLRDLGINAIEIMPVMEFAGDHSWGYNPSHPFAIETAYGGPDGLKHFIFEAHIRGIAVIMDVVFNHFGPSDMDLWQFDGWKEGDYGGIYFYNDHKAKTPWGENRPDYGRKEVLNYLRDNALMWLDTFQCDGLRFDATAFIRYMDHADPHNHTELKEGYAFLQSLNSELKERFPHKILIAEDLQADPVVTADIEHNGLGFHTQWGTGFAHGIKRVLLEVHDRHRNLQLVVESLFTRFNNDAFQRIIFTESHDHVANGSSRLPEEIQPGEADGEYAKKKSTLGAITLFTAPGIPMIFQGQEFLTYGSFSDTNPLDWSWQANFNGISIMFRDLINLRKGLDPALIGLSGQGTETLHFNQETLVLAYSRTHLDHLENPALIILNFSDHERYDYKVGVPFEGDWHVKFNSGWKGYDQDFSEIEVSSVHTGDGIEDKPFSIVINLPAYGGVILAK